MDNNERPNNTEGEVYTRQRAMSVWGEENSLLREYHTWCKQAVSQVRDKEEAPTTGAPHDKFKSTTPASETSKCYDTTMQQSQKQKLQKLWWTLDTIYVWFNRRVRGIYNYVTRLGRKYGIRNRPHRQQWALRKRQLEILYPHGTGEKSENIKICNIQRKESTRNGGISFNQDNKPRDTVFPPHNRESNIVRIDGGTNDGAVLSPVRQTKRVYDITNAGPRHRFTVSGRLVSNCLSLIYGTGAAKLKDTIRTQSKGKTSVTIEEAERLKDLYRRVNKYVKEAWYEGGSIIDWIAHDESHTAYGFLPVHGKKGILKPSGLYLPYPGLRQEHNEKGTEWYYDTKRGRNILKDKIYAAKCYQRINQSLARDIVATQTMEIDKH